VNIEHPQNESRSVVGRMAGLAALCTGAVFLAVLIAGAGGTLHSNLTGPQAVAWAAQNGQLIRVTGFADGLVNTLFAVVVVLLVVLSGGRGVPATLAYIGAGAAVANQWAHAGMLYALAELAQQGAADAGVLALFSLGSTMDDADAIPLALALGSLGFLLLRSRVLPAPVAWFTVVLAAVNVVSTPAEILGLGVVNLIEVALSFVWMFVFGVTLLIRPVRVPETLRMAVAADA
jgi:hypothetical protein